MAFPLLCIKQMTLFLFNKLSPQNQIKTLKLVGAYLATRLADGKWLYLFQIDAFYVELCYDKNGSGIQTIKSFEGTKALQPYLDEINIESLLMGQ